MDAIDRAIVHSRNRTAAIYAAFDNLIMEMEIGTVDYDGDRSISYHLELLKLMREHYN